MLTRGTARSRIRSPVSLFTAVLLIAASLLQLARADSPPKEWDGLELRKSKNVQRLYVRPEATLAGYKRVRLEPLQVSFAKDWDPNRGKSGSYRLDQEDFDRIKKGLADEFVKVCDQELAKGGYTLTAESSEDVLDVTPMIVDLFIAAPDNMTAGRVTNYTADPGRMALVAELRDSQTGQIIARVVDRRVARSTGTFQVANSVTNMSAARQIIARWASALRGALDAANAAANAKPAT